MSVTQQNILPDFISAAIKSKLEDESKKLIEEAKKRLEERTPEIITSVVVDIMQMVEMKMLEDRIVFTIRKP